MNLNAPGDVLWSSAALPVQLGGRALNGPVGDIISVSIDTRTLEPGGVFFAIKGGVHDGHDFVPIALEKGAICVIDDAHAAPYAGANVIVVPDVLQAMERLGRLARARMQGAVIAVTGSVGKTSTKEMLRNALTRQGRTHASVASYNNHWGVPLTLARMPKDSLYGVFEIGMSASFEILPLTAMVRPHVAIVTTVEPVHLEFFPAIEAIADAKGEIFAGLEAGGVALINADNAQAGRLAAHAGASRAGRIVRFGTAEGADIRMLDLHLDPDFSVVSARVFGIPVTYRIGAPGRHLAMNSLAVLGAAHVIGADLALTALSLQDFSTVEGRGKRLELQLPTGSFTLIDESFNANPSSMRAALAVTGSIPRGMRARRIAILGDMLELGPESPKLHGDLCEAIEEHAFDLVFAAGPLMKNLYSALPLERRGAYAESAHKLTPMVLDAIGPGDVVMVKGSKGSLISTIVAAFKARFAMRSLPGEIE